MDGLLQIIFKEDAITIFHVHDQTILYMLAILKCIE